MKRNFWGIWMKNFHPKSKYICTVPLILWEESSFFIVPFSFVDLCDSSHPSCSFTLHPGKSAVAALHPPRNIHPLTQIGLVEVQYGTLNNTTNSKKYFFNLKSLTLSSTSQTQRGKEHFGSAKLWHYSFYHHSPNRSLTWIPRVSICFRKESRAAHNISSRSRTYLVWSDQRKRPQVIQWIFVGNPLLSRRVFPKDHPLLHQTNPQIHTAMVTQLIRMVEYNNSHNWQY